MIASSALAEELQLACTLAQKAGQLILRHYAHGVAVEYKDADRSDPVTQADRDANQLIVEGLQQRFPRDAVLSEESPDTLARMAHARLWCIDPLDGTRDFVDRTNDFVVMIGLAVDGEARLGAIYQPTADVLLAGITGPDTTPHRSAFWQHGAERRPLQVSRTHSLPQARLLVSRTHPSATVLRLAATWGIEHILPVGSVGLKVGAIAMDQADLYMSLSTRTHEWDTCAPEAVLKAAGGNLSSLDGTALLYNKYLPNTQGGILATNGMLHTDAVQALHEATPSWG